MSTGRCQRCGDPLPPVKRARPRKWCSNNCRVRAFDARGKPCRCGRRKSVRAIECRTCQLEGRKAVQVGRFESVKRMWDEGLSIKAIASEIDTTPNALGVLINRMRRAGWEMPLRRANAHQPPATKKQCRERFANAIANSDIRRPKRCEECGELAFIEGHHEDYSRPLYVTWLCQPCHLALHSKERRKAAA